MGYLLLGFPVLATLGLLWLIKLRGSMLTLTAVAIAFGCAGYALQGSPDVEAQPRAAARRAPPMPLTGARQAMTGQFDYADTWLNMADALASRGRTEERPGCFRPRLLATRATTSCGSAWAMR